jgi:hypothetical protein
MWNLQLVREIVSVLMESACYFQLGLKERHRLVKDLCLSVNSEEPEVIK